MAHDVFVSYASEDKTTADAVVATLEQRQIRCWIAPRDVLPGRDYASAIVEAISAAKVMILVFSAEANKSLQVMREVERAASRGIAILPFRIEDVTPSESMEFFISGTHWLDALTPPLKRHLDSLADKTQLLLQTAPEPSEPSVVPTPQVLPDDGPSDDGPLSRWRKALSDVAASPRGGRAAVVLGAGAVGAVVIIALVTLLSDGPDGPDDGGDGGVVPSDQVVSDDEIVPPIFEAVADSYVDSGEPTTNFGASNVLRVDGIPTEQKAILGFEVVGLEREPSSARLELTCSDQNVDFDEGATTVAESVWTIQSTWEEGVVTWENFPDTVEDQRSDGPGSVDCGQTDNVIAYDVNIPADGSYTFILGTASGDGITLNSRESDSPPRLVIEPLGD